MKLPQATRRAITPPPPEPRNRAERRRGIRGGRWRLRATYRSIIQRGVLAGELERTT